MTTIETNTRLYIANLGKYCEGCLVGEWIDLPFTEEELQALFVRIGLAHNDEDGEYIPGVEVDGIVYEEHAIHDYETDFDALNIGEYSDLWHLNEQVETLESLPACEAEKLQAAMAYFGYELADVIDRPDDFILHSDIQNEYDLGYYWAVESGCYDMDENSPFANYIDYERFGRDISFDTNGGFTDWGFIEEC